MNADDLPLERRPALGSDCARPEYFAGARTSFTKFIAAERAVGGRPPIGTNGVPQMWNERRGWHDDTATDGPRATSPRRLPMLEILTRQRQQAERISAEDARSNPRAIRSKLRHMAEQAERINGAGASS